MRTQPSLAHAKTPTKRLNKNVGEATFGLLYILPSFILLCVFYIIPILMNVYYSFTKYNVMQPPEWIGLKNFTRLIGDQNVLASIKNTAIFTAITVPLQTILALVLAAIIAEHFRDLFGKFVKSSLFVPVIASAILVGGLWSIFLGTRGPLNVILDFLGLPTINWFGKEIPALVAICLTSVWKNVGYFLVIYFAGIMDIPVSLYEAAKVDGANPIQRFFRITLPSLSSVTYLVVTLGTIWSFQVFDLVYTMTGGGPGRATMTLVLTIYNSAFKERSMGYASAVALVMFGFVILISALQKLLMKDRSEEG